MDCQIHYYVPLGNKNCYHLNRDLPSFERYILASEVFKYENAHLRVGKIWHLAPVLASLRK